MNKRASIITTLVTVVALIGIVGLIVSGPETANATTATPVAATTPVHVQCPPFAHYVDETGGWWIYVTDTTPMVKATPSGWWIKAAATSATYVLMQEDNEIDTVRWNADGTAHTDAIAIGRTPATRCDLDK